MHDSSPGAAVASPAARSPERRGSAAGLFLVSASTLGLEVALTRVLSVSLWYHFAFLVVSTAVLGFGLSGVALSLPGRLRDATAARLHLVAAAYAASIAVCFALCNALPFDPFALLSEKRQLVLLPVYSLALTLPFFLSGVTVALLLLRDPAQVGRLYAWDLAGAGLGAALIVGAFGPLGGSGAVLACAAVAALGAVFLSLPRGRGAVLAASLLTLACAALALGAERLLPVRIPENRLINEPTPVAALLRDPARLLDTRWNALGRVDLVTGQPSWLLLLDGGAAVTRLPDASGPFERHAGGRSPAWLGYRITTNPRVLVIGSGGGWEVLGALANGARSVTAVEVNPAINDLVTSGAAPGLQARLGALFTDPRVTLVTDEGRSFLRRTPGPFDVIVSAHTISNAASAAGALALSESYTLTAEAFDDLLARLAPGGVLLMTRPELQLPRLVATAGEALARKGLDPAACVAAARSPGPAGRSFLGLMLVRNGPIDAPLVERLRALFGASNLEPLLLPGDGNGPPIYRELLASPEPEAIYRHEPANLRPATDDRPFFNQHLRWSALRPRDLLRVLQRGGEARLAFEDAPVAEVALLLFLAQAAVLGAVFLLLPLRALRREGARARARGPFLGYLAAIGFGFMFVELGLVQRFTLFIGPPTITFAVVVGALLVSSGLGSRLFAAADPARALPWLLPLAALLIVALALGAPLVARAALGWPLPLRALVSALLIAPLGLALGAPFPLGMRLAEARAPALLPWLWGVNGFASVLASAGSLIVATALGFTAVLLCGAGAYLLALLSVRAALRGEQPPARPE